MEMDTNARNLKTASQSPHLRLEDSHPTPSHPEISPYIALFEELNQGETCIPNQQHFGLTGQGQNG